jgi:hypothetical protein
VELPEVHEKLGARDEGEVVGVAAGGELRPVASSAAMA